MLRIAIQAKGRLNEQSLGLLLEAGIAVAEGKRRLIARAEGFPLEVLFLRDDDIPQAVSMGVADLGIVGQNEVAEKGYDVEQAMPLGFGACRLSLAVPNAADYTGPDYFHGRRVATSYPNILRGYFARQWDQSARNACCKALLLPFHCLQRSAEREHDISLSHTHVITPAQARVPHLQPKAPLPPY